MIEHKVPDTLLESLMNGYSEILKSFVKLNVFKDDVEKCLNEAMDSVRQMASFREEKAYEDGLEDMVHHLRREYDKLKEIYLKESK